MVEGGLAQDFTARSRTSGENLFDFFMAQSSQRKEPPQNTGRFSASRSMDRQTYRPKDLQQRDFVVRGSPAHDAQAGKGNSYGAKVK